MFTAVSDTARPFLADLMRYQCDFSATRENNCDLSITRGHLHMFWKRSVGWGWWWARPDGRCHHVLDYRMHVLA